MFAYRYMPRTSILVFNFISSFLNTQHVIFHFSAHPCIILLRVYSWVYYVMSIAASEESVDHSLQDKKDGTSLIDLISDSEQVESVIDDTGDHVLKLSFMNSSLEKQNSQRRYLF